MKLLLALGALGAATTASPPQPDGALLHPDITRAAARQRADQLFEQFDVNHDGFVTRPEAETVATKLRLLRAASGRDSAPGIGGHTLRFLRRRFDGVEAVTKPQFEAAFLAHFDDMDANHDGILTAAERLHAR